MLYPERLPADPRTWEQEARSNLIGKFQTSNIHSLHDAYRDEGREKLLTSASKISYAQFLLLRTLWQENKQSNFEMSDWLPENMINQARSLLERNCPDWKEYLNVLQRDAKGLTEKRPKIGHFFPILDEQREIQLSKPVLNEADAVDKYYDYDTPKQTAFHSTPGAPYKPRLGPDQPLNPEANQHDIRSLGEKMSSVRLQDTGLETPKAPEDYGHPEHASPLASSAPAAEDENKIGAVAIAFFNSTLLFEPRSRLKWYHRREIFHFEKLFEARTDGVLRVRDDLSRLDKEVVLAISEFKPFLRNSHKSKIRMQESAQLASWISEEPDSGVIRYTDAERDELRIPEGIRRRLLVSQDHGEIYLIFAEYDDNYVRFVKNEKDIVVHKKPFLRLREYGPFRIDKASHMETVGTFLLAFAIHQSSSEWDKGLDDLSDPGTPCPPPRAGGRVAIGREPI